jgi:ATP-binding cassette subfamily F protein uup
VGGYEDWLRQRATVGTDAADSSGRAKSVRGGGRTRPDQQATAATAGRPAIPKRLTWSEQRELEQLPPRIEALEAEEQRLHTAIAAPEFYKEPRAVITQALARVEQLKGELLDAYARWDELDSRTT